MTQQLLEIQKSGSLFSIRLNRPGALNALNLELLTQMKTALIDAYADPDIKTIWLESTSQRAFSAGGDVKSLAVALQTVSLPIEKINLSKKYFELEYSIDLLIEQSPKPVVAFSEGITFGGGWGLFAGANLKLCSSTASFAMPEIQIGFFPDVGAAHFLQQSYWKLGTFIGISGITLSAQEAMALDYVDSIITQDYAQTLKRQLSSGIDTTELDISYSDRESEQVHDHWMAAIDLLPETGTLTDWIAIAEQNNQFAPFKRADKSWESASAWSIAFTWQYFRAMRQKSRAQVLDSDTKAGSQMSAHSEFTEGVQAKLINKKSQPTWLYPHVESVPIEEIMDVID